jgi:putative transcriptional regulator
MLISKRKDEGAKGGHLADQPLHASDLKRMWRTPQVKIIRRALGLTQEEFSARYRIPLGTLRDWEEGRTEPDQPATAYLRVIAAEPTTTAKALEQSASL